MKPFDKFPRRYFEPSEIILREGGYGDCAYIVERGMVEISRGQGDGRRVLGTIGPGGIFGEMSLIDHKARVADATALRQTICIVIPAEVMDEKLDRTDPFIKALLRILVRNIRSMVEEEERRGLGRNTS